MKQVILVMAALLVSLNASANPVECERLEAQFIGTVTNIEESADSCLVTVGNTTHWYPSILCPLDDREFEKTGVVVANKDGVCPYAVGDKISGVAVTEGDIIVID